MQRQRIVINSGSISFHATTSKVLKPAGRVTRAPSTLDFPTRQNLLSLLFPLDRFRELRANYSRVVINEFAAVAAAYLAIPINIPISPFAPPYPGISNLNEELTVNLTR